MSAPSKALPARLAAPAAIAVGAVALRLLSGVGFVNYDTLYALAWGGQLARGETPQYAIPTSARGVLRPVRETCLCLRYWCEADSRMCSVRRE